jgi:4a-hydroxytetrahydrobiopterin dehydratase
MSEESKERVYEPDEIEARLKRELPHWRYENGWIRRTFRTSGWKGTLMVINAVGHLAEAAWHHPDIAASYAWVEVKLQNHSAKRITDKDFELARKIEDFVSWRPGKEGGALEGTPTGDQRFAYIKYDDVIRALVLITAVPSPCTCVRGVHREGPQFAPRSS